MKPTEFPSISKIGIIGDVHAEAKTLSAVLAFLDAELAVSAILCTGDIVDGRGSVDACVDLLKKYGVLTVRGNHDDWFASDQMRSISGATLYSHVSFDSQDYLGKLPSIREFQTAHGNLMLCHGIGNNDMACIMPGDFGYALEMNYDLRKIVHAEYYAFMINGHSHQKMVRKFGNLTVINAGTLFWKHAPCFFTADFDAGILQVYSIDDLGEISEEEFVDFANLKSEKVAPLPFKW